MADDQPLLHVDTDWKKQAQEEKRKLAEAAAKSKPAPAAPMSSPGSTSSAASVAAQGSPSPGARRGARALPAPGLGSLIQSTMTQILYYLGELQASTGSAGIDLDMAKHHLDVLTILEEKTKGNLTPEEQTMVDAALYETRTRFVNTASQFLGP
jgi:Domain of unknown function (DUF1844)